MELKLLRAEFNGIKLFKDQKFEFDFIARRKVTSDELDENVVEHLFSSIYKHNLISLAGINASGKTTALKLLSLVFELYIENKTFDSITNKEVLNHFNDEAKVVNYFYINHKIYQLTSIIVRTKSGNFEYKDEWLKVKKARSNMSKEEVFNFNEVSLDRTREAEKEKAKGYLKNVMSIFTAILEENDVNDDEKYVFDMMQFTNLNIIGTIKKIPESYIQYLDPGIEYIEFVDREKHTNFAEIPVNIKFFEQEVIQVTAIDLWEYLSSGTIKGLNLLMAIEKVLHTGGYMIVDELENHLNKTVAITLMNLFKSQMNTRNATLIFSTHYSELLDDIERSDSIYFSTKQQGEIQLNNLSQYLNRSDKKKSNIYLSGLLGTAPKFKGYQALKKSLKKEINKRDEFESEA